MLYKARLLKTALLTFALLTSIVTFFFTTPFFISPSYARLQDTPSLEVTILEPFSAGPWDLAAGSPLSLQTKNGLTQALFLSKVVYPQSKQAHYMFLDLNRSRVYWANESQVTWKTKNNKNPYSNKTQVTLNPYAQVGNTCAAYGIFHYFLQKKISKPDQGKMKEVLNTEQERTQLLAQAISQYYVDRPNHASFLGVYKRLGESLGLSCRMHSLNSLSKITSLIQEKLLQSNPVLLGFNIGSDMVESSYPVYDEQDLTSFDERLWVPRRRGQKLGGAHAIVLSAYFEMDQRPYAVVIDSDWEEPRIWDISKYLNSKVPLNELEVYSCD